MSSSSPTNLQPALPISDLFRASFTTTATATYPRNLIDRSNYPATLNEYRGRFEENAPRLFTTDPTKICITFRDFNTGQSDCDKTNVLSAQGLDRRLGDQSAQGGSKVTKKDPVCRFIFLSALHARAALYITQEAFEKLATYHQLPAQYLDLLFLFGQSEGPSEPTMGSFWSQTSFNQPLDSAKMLALNRSCVHYEMCFNLKGVGCKNPTADYDERRWSIRHAAVFHRFDVATNASLWLITKGDWQIKERVKEMTSDADRPEARSFTTAAECLSSTLAIHLLLAHWAGESWRWYIQWIEKIIEQKTRQATIGNTTSSGKPSYKIYTGADLQEVQYYEEKANEVGDVLDTNLHILASLREFYNNLLSNDDYPLKRDVQIQHAIGVFSQRIKNMYHEVEMQISRSKALVKFINRRKALILQHMHAQNAKDMAGLTEKTIDVAISSQKEAIAMRIVTVVTLVYLPATFVSTFFSTDVVKYQGGGDTVSLPASNTQYSNTAMIRWIQVTLPLTAITLVLAAIAYWWARRPLGRPGLDLEHGATALMAPPRRQASFARTISGLTSIRGNFQFARRMGSNMEMTSRVSTGFR